MDFTYTVEKEQLRNNMKRHNICNYSWVAVVGRLSVTYLMYYLRHENLWSEAYEEAHFTKQVQKSDLSSKKHLHMKYATTSMIMRYI